MLENTLRLRETIDGSPSRMICDVRKMCVDYKSPGICTVDDFLIGRVPLVKGGWSENQMVDYHLIQKRDQSYARSDANFRRRLERG